jgi:probable phosphoglycerate mutase
MTNIYIARHGETEYNRTGRIQGRGINESINKNGRKQAQCIARSLQDVEINYIFSSSLNRSVETAQIIGEHLGVPVQSFPELDEMNFGVIEGRPISEIEEHLQDLHHNWRSGNTAFALEQGESPDAVLERVISRTDMLTKKHRGKNMLYVLHGRLIRILLAQWLQYGLNKMHQIEHCNGALYHLQLNENEEFEPIFLNKREHLKAGS